MVIEFMLIRTFFSSVVERWFGRECAGHTIKSHEYTLTLDGLPSLSEKFEENLSFTRFEFPNEQRIDF